MSDVRYPELLKARTEQYAKRAKVAYEILSTIPELIIHKPQGAFYMTAVFKEGVLNSMQTLPIKNPAVFDVVEKLVKPDFSLDKRFVYYLLGATGLCVVPLQSGFNATSCGFRFTLLENDENKFRHNIEILKQAITTYLAT